MALPPSHSHGMTLSPNYLLWSNLLSCLHYRPSAFTRVEHFKLSDGAIGSCHFFSPQKPFSRQRLVSCESTYALLSSQHLAPSSSCWKDLTSLVGPVTAHRPIHPYRILNWSFLTFPPHPLGKERTFYFPHMLLVMCPRRDQIHL